VTMVCSVDLHRQQMIFNAMVVESGKSGGCRSPGSWDHRCQAEVMNVRSAST
jgi:hypothetical protein